MSERIQRPSIPLATVGKVLRFKEGTTQVLPGLYIPMPPTIRLVSSEIEADIRVSNEDLNEVATEWIDRFKASRESTEEEVSAE